MKNIIKKASLLTLLLLGITCISNASVTVSFTLTINDYASPAWTRDYCAQVYVMEGNVQHCVEQLTKLTVGPNQISYECYLPYSESDPNYSIICNVWREGYPLIGAQGSELQLYFNQVISGFTNVIVNIY
ncbi:MAG TPA: hypothetical protein PKJ28_01585 [Bacteroidales bacterium]|nr:hypothetical protein [Bacteroidales bacterium]HPS72803.1 hypothetical protein [Bacteroidales bacterium]